MNDCRPRAAQPCDELRDAVPVRVAGRGPAGLAERARLRRDAGRRATRSTARASRRPASSCCSSGTISMHRQVENTDVETTRTNQRGVYAGATQAFLGPATEPYPTSVRAVTDCTFWVIDAGEFGDQDPRVVPDGHAHAGGAGPGHAGQPGDGRAAGAAAVARPAVGRADPRAEQPGRRGGPGHGDACASGSARCGASWPTWPPPTSTRRPWRC